MQLFARFEILTYLNLYFESRFFVYKYVYAEDRQHITPKLC